MLEILDLGLGEVFGEEDVSDKAGGGEWGARVEEVEPVTYGEERVEFEPIPVDAETTSPISRLPSALLASLLLRKGQKEERTSPVLAQRRRAQVHSL